MRPIRFAPTATVTAALLLAGGLTACSHSSNKTASAKVTVSPTEPKALHSFDTAAIDKSADPCTNFYQYACGDWVKNNPIPADQSRWGTFNQLAERNNYLLFEQLKKAANNPQDAMQKRYGTFFAACMDVDQANQLGAKPLEPTLNAIDGMTGKGQIAEFLGSKKYVGGGFFYFGVQQDQKNSSDQIAALGQAGLTLPDKSYYLEDNPRMQKIRSEYHEYLMKMFGLLGDDGAKAQAEAKNVMDIETALAKGSMARVDMREPKNVYHPMQKQDLDQLASDFKWADFFQGVDPPQFTKINVAQPDYFKTMAQVINSTPLPALKSYLRLHAADSVAPFLSEPFDQLQFDFFAKTLRGQDQEQPRWKRCTSLTNRQFGEAVGQDWVKQYFPPQDKQSMEQLVANLKQSLGNDLKHVSWMSEPTKKKALDKLAAFRQKIGYPEHWRSYAGINVTPNNFVADLQNAEQFNYQWHIDHIGKPVNEKEWGMTPPTVNAYYDPPLNDINFPAGILQPPFYSQTADSGVNYGGIGVVIGHEMTHGFDDEGSQYGPHGNVENWFTPADRKAFDKKTSCLVNEYGNFQAAPGAKLNGKLTLGENTADNGGLRISYAAMQKAMAAEPASERSKKRDGYTQDQQFFISFAQIWCNNTKPQTARMMAKVDPHSPGEFRTNGSVQNFPEFGKAFGCHTGQPMMPANICRVW